MKSKLLKLFTRWDFLAVAGVFILVLVVSYLTFFTPNYYTASQPVTFDIKRDGESFSSVVDRLYEQGIISSKNNFKIAGFIYGSESKIRAARFHIPNGLSYLIYLICSFQVNVISTEH